MFKKKSALILFYLILITFYFSPADASSKYKVLHVMSYHSPWEWTDDQFKAFKKEMEGLDIEYKVYQMDTKRRSTVEWKEQAGREARELIESWKPDLVYTNDDNVQEYVAKFYVNQDTPFVFSAVNSEPSAYGFTGSSNITGVLEQEHSVETIKLLREIVPSVKRIAIIIDDDPTWGGVVERIKKRVSLELPEIELIVTDPIRTFSEYQYKIEEYQGQVDALGLLGVHTFKNEEGNNVAWQEVLEWTAENSDLPDFTFWKDRISYGTLCAVYVCAFEQGMAAGKMARVILAEGKSPAGFPIEPTIKGRPTISLARAKKLGIDIKSKLLLTSEIVQKFEWEK